MTAPTMVPSPFVQLSRATAPRPSVELSIDGQTVGAVEGTTILAAGRAVGLEIPRLCFLETLHPGSVIAPAHIDPGLRRGVVFMTLHFPDDVATNLLTINATDPKSGTAEFKACAVSLQLATQMMPTFGQTHRELAAAGDD